MRCDSFVCVSHTRVSWPRKCPRKTAGEWDLTCIWNRFRVHPGSVKSAAAAAVTRRRLKALQEVTADSCLVIYNLETFFFLFKLALIVAFAFVFVFRVSLIPLPSAIGIFLANSWLHLPGRSLLTGLATSSFYTCTKIFDMYMKFNKSINKRFTLMQIRLYPE